MRSDEPGGQPQDEEDERAPPADEPGQAPRRGAEAIRQAVDSLRSAAPGRDRPRLAHTEQLPADAHERVREGLEDVAYVQHEYATRGGVHVCRVGIREEATIRDEIVVVGPEGVAEREQIEARIDELRQGASHDETDRLVT